MDDSQGEEFELFPLFQVIKSLTDGNDFAYEATIRGRSGDRVLTPANLFRKAQVDGCIVFLDNQARKTAIREAVMLNPKAKLFLNCHGESLVANRIFDDITKLEIPLDRIVLEITEQSRIRNTGSIKQELDKFRRRGMKLALDDFGAGFSNFYLVEALRPDFIKLDRSIVAPIDGSNQAKDVIEGLVAFAEKAHTKLIAEGIETKAQLDVLKELGIGYGQGFFLGYPFELHQKVKV